MNSLARVLVLAVVALAAVALTVPSASGAIRIAKIRYNSPGSDTGSNASLNAEWIRIKNTSSGARALGGWRVRDNSGHVYTFATRYRLGGGKTVMIHTGNGANSARHRYWGQGNYVWNNDRDRATLKNAGGKVIDRCSYNNPSASSKEC